MDLGPRDQHFDHNMYCDLVKLLIDTRFTFSIRGVPKGYDLRFLFQLFKNPLDIQ